MGQRIEGISILKYFVRCGEEVGIHGGVGGAVFGDDDILDEPDGETGGDDGV